MNLHIPVLWNSSLAHVTEPRARRSTLSILVVDDETSVRSFVSRALETVGCEVVVAGSGAEALERLKEMAHCDLVVTDLMMPNMNGDELGRRLRVEDPDIKVLYLTGFSDRLFADKVMLWDGEAFLDKPCSPKAVMEAVSLLLSGRLNTVLQPQAVTVSPL